MTKSRMREFGPEVELNPVVKFFGPTYGPYFVVASNTLWVLMLINHPILLGVFTGFKLALAYLQLLSLGQHYGS